MQDTFDESLNMALHDAQLELAATREREHRLQTENRLLLKGIATLTRSQSIHGLLETLIQILRPLIGFEHAAILYADDAGSKLDCVVASDPQLEQQRWHAGVLFQRVLGGETVALFDPSQSPEFAACHPSVQKMAGSVLLTALQLVQGKLMLICCHSQCHRLNLTSRSLIQRYRPLMDQALLNVDYRARLERLVEEKTQALRRSQTSFRQFAEMASDWFWITDRDYRFVPFPDDIARGDFTSRLMDQIVGRRFVDYRTDREQAKVEKWRRYSQDLEAHKSIRAFRFEVLFNGQERWLSINADPYFDEDGHFAGYQGTVNDITSQIVRNQELKRAKQRADAANRAKSQFLAVMSHEIRTPMQAILGMLELLEQSELTSTQRELIHHVSHSASLLQTLLHDVLDLSRIESRAMQLESIPFSSRFVLNSVITQLSEQARNKGIALRLDMDPQLPSHLQGDPLRLTQILFNLLGNAIKFTVRGHVVLSVQRDGDTLVFSVSDTGVGIPEARCHELFHLFRQLDPSTTRRFGGTGLGLAISKRLVELMHGEIGVESQVGVGSRFWFRIPLIEAEGGIRTELPRDEPEYDSIPPQHVLLVEDSIVNQQVLQAMLRKLGHKVTLAVNGRLAIEAVREMGPDVVLMDLRMPEMDGLEATRHIRLTHPQLPILALTANVSDEDMRDCRAAGMCDIIGKPVTSARLQQALLLACGQKKWST
ncbi:ATP-binding protein [Pseudaeromonas sharmana]|uniref:histidine kinase n=1 Tax=Pseudaeromonas sharmana TaxID=328412 RepID=A0ABV8CRE9_9GAMM